MNAEGQYLGLEGVYLIHPGSEATVYSDEFLQEGDAATLSLDVTHKMGAVAVRVDFETRTPEDTSFDVAATFDFSSTGMLIGDVPMTKQICRLAFTFIAGNAKSWFYLVWSVGWRPEPEQDLVQHAGGDGDRATLAFANQPSGWSPPRAERYASGFCKGCECAPRTECDRATEGSCEDDCGEGLDAADTAALRWGIVAAEAKGASDFWALASVAHFSRTASISPELAIRLSEVQGIANLYCASTFSGLAARAMDAADGQDDLSVSTTTQADTSRRKRKLYRARGLFPDALPVWGESDDLPGGETLIKTSSTRGWVYFCPAAAPAIPWIWPPIGKGLAWLGGSLLLLFAAKRRFRIRARQGEDDPPWVEWAPQECACYWNCYPIRLAPGAGFLVVDVTDPLWPEGKRSVVGSCPPLIPPTCLNECIRMEKEFEKLIREGGNLMTIMHPGLRRAEHWVCFGPGVCEDVR